MVDSQKQNSRLNTAISNAGRRYNTEVNLQIHNILGSLYALNRDSRYITDLLKLAYKLKHQVAYRIADHKDKNAEIVKLKRDIDNLVASLIAIKNKNKNQNIRWKSILTKLDDTASAMYELYRFLKDLQDEERKGDPYAKTTVETGNTWSAYQALNDIKEFLSDKRTRLFNTPRMILRGDAGIGKTHLLCDYAKSRIDTGKPTLIFLAHELSASTSTDPIECMASLLQCRTKKAFLDDLQKLTTKSMDRVCIIIDAVNEADQMDWSALKQLFSISNLSVVVSVRNGYESVIKNTNQYTTIEHYGFADMEWEAIDTFFKHHKMKLPEIPIVDPEFRNPLFLSIFCESYAGKKDKTPRGHGATHVFEIYVETQSKKILEEIGLDKLPKDYLWKNVIKKMGILMGNSGNPHVTKTELLSIIRNDTKLISHDDKLIPLMEHHGLVMKYPKYNKNYKRNGYYYGFTYNRFSDHLIVRSILTENKIDTREKAERFFKDGKFLDNNLFNVGLLEALSIHLRGRCNKTELVWAVPKKYRDSSSVKTAFLGGVKWRDVDSIDKKTGGLKFIDETQVIKYMNDFFTHSRYDFNNVMDCILDVCAIPSHPLNALRLHKILSKHTLPHRDAWLQEFLLHRSYEDGNAINRLQSWSLSSLVSHASVESTELAATVLAWTLSSTNPKLRDRSTRAMVSLLKGYQDALLRVLNRFIDNDDPYIQERLFAVAYGALSLKPDNQAHFMAIAKWFYDKYFMNESRRPDALSDDYAKGVIELYLRHYKNNIHIKRRNITPPFKYYEFPKRIPTTKYLRKKYRDDSDNDMSYYSIWGSVMYGEGESLADFGNYTMHSVLGDLSNISVTDKPPTPQKDAYNEFVKKLSEKQHQLFDSYNASKFNMKFSIIDDLGGKKIEATPSDTSSVTSSLRAFEKSLGIFKLRKYRKMVSSRIDKRSTHRHRYEYDLNIARRWVFNRTIKLGWNPKMHQEYDRARGSYDRIQSGNAERIGKKYQRIALSEFVALAGSNYYLRKDRWSKNTEFIKYHGSYQTSLRDFDPTLDPVWLLTKRDEDDLADVWWVPKYNSWGIKNWHKSKRDIPKPKSLAEINEDGVTYLNLLSWKTWKGPSDTPEDTGNNNYPDLFMHVNGYIVRKKELPTIKEWCAKQKFCNSRLPEPHDESGVIFMKEMTDSSAYVEVAKEYQTDWIKKSNEIPFDVLPPIEGYSGSGFEADDTSKSARIYTPSAPLQKMLGLQITAKIGEYRSKNGKIRMLDPSVDYSSAYPALLVNKDEFLKALNKRGLTVVWSVLGEKMFIGDAYSKYRGQRLEVHGFCYIEDGKIVEEVRYRDE